MVRAALAGLGAAVVASAAAAEAPEACKERQTLVDQLARGYDEAPVAMGLASNGGIVEVLRSDKGATWTILITLPNGMSCMIAAGESWEEVEFMLPDPAV